MLAGSTQPCLGVHADSGAQPCGPSPVSLQYTHFTKLPLQKPVHKCARRPRTGEGFPQFAPYSSVTPCTWPEASLSLHIARDKKSTTLAGSRAPFCPNCVQGEKKKTNRQGDKERRRRRRRGTITYHRFAAPCCMIPTPRSIAKTLITSLSHHFRLLTGDLFLFLLL